MKKIDNQNLLYEGYTREQINLDETSEIVTTRSLAKGVSGYVVDIRCPARYKIIIVGKNQLQERQEGIDSENDSENAHSLVVRFANSNNDEVAPDTRIRTTKEKVSGDMTTIGVMLYEDITVTDYQKDNQEKMKSPDKWYKFDQGIKLNGEEHLRIYVINPDIDIDAKNVKLGLDIDLWEGE